MQIHFFFLLYMSTCNVVKGAKLPAGWEWELLSWHKAKRGWEKCEEKGLDMGQEAMPAHLKRAVHSVIRRIFSLKFSSVCIGR
jgi:hypothetical protein